MQQNFRNTVQDTLDNAIRFSIDSQHQSGAWDGPLSSRIFETALAVLAIRRDAPQSAEYGRRWLEDHPPIWYHELAFRYESILRLMALGYIGTVDLSDGGLYDSVMLRKTLALYALARREKLSPQTLWPSEQVLPRLAEFYNRRRVLNIKGWALSDFLSSYAILLTAEGQLARARRVAQEVLDIQSEDGSWYRNTISTCLALCATEVLPLAGAQRQAGIRFLQEVQQSDGGWSYCHIPIWDTAITLSALGKVIPTGSPVWQAGAKYLLASQNTDGGWGFYPGLESENDSTCAVLDALMDCDNGLWKQRAIDFLQHQQTPDGLWPVWRRAERPSTEVVAHIVRTLRTVAPERNICLEQPCNWLRQQQDPDGFWTADWCANVPYAICNVLRATPLTTQQKKRTILYMRSQQHGDGGWGGEPGAESNPSATAQGVMACLLLGLIIEAHHGIHYLVQEQLESGSWHSPSEVIGPRPLRYAVQASTHAFCLHALLQYSQSHESKAEAIPALSLIGAAL